MSRSCRKCRGATLRFLLTVAAIAFSLAALTCIPQAAAQDAPTLSRTITVTSDPPGATVWKKEGATLICMDTATPATVDLAFRGDNDVRRLRVRRFGYSGVNLDVRSSDKEVAAVLNLSKSVSSSFLVESDAPPDVKQLDEALKKEFEKTVLADAEAFRCAPFDLRSVALSKAKETGAVQLNIALKLDRSFGGLAFRQASHAFSMEDRRKRMGQIALDEGIAEILGRFHRIAAKFADIKDIVVIGSHSTTEAYIDTEKTSRVETQTKWVQEMVPTIGGGQHMQAVAEQRQVWVTDEKEVVKDRDAERALTFVMPNAQIPDTLDKKVLSEAVLAAGSIVVESSVGKE